MVPLFGVDRPLLRRVLSGSRRRVADGQPRGVELPVDWQLALVTHRHCPTAADGLPISPTQLVRHPVNAATRTFVATDVGLTRLEIRGNVHRLTAAQDSRYRVQNSPLVLSFDVVSWLYVDDYIISWQLAVT